MAGCQPVSSTVPEFMATPIVSSYRGRVWFVWSDPRQYGLQIYGNNSVYLPTAVDEDKPQVPTSFSLGQNYPNPFNPSTEIEFKVAKAGLTTLKVYDIVGREIATLVNQNMNPGTFRAKLDGTNLATRTYIYTLTSGDARITKKMMLLK